MRIFQDGFDATCRRCSCAVLWKQMWWTDDWCWLKVPQSDKVTTTLTYFHLQNTCWQSVEILGEWGWIHDILWWFSLKCSMLQFGAASLSHSHGSQGHLSHFLDGNTSTVPAATDVWLINVICRTKDTQSHRLTRHACSQAVRMKPGHRTEN